MQSDRTIGIGHIAIKDTLTSKKKKYNAGNKKIEKRDPENLYFFILEIFKTQLDIAL